MSPLLLTAFLAITVGPVSPDGACRQPQLASQGSIAAMTFGCGKSIYFTQSADGGRSFSIPVKVATPDVLALGWHRGPRIAFSGNAIVITAVAGKDAGNENLLAWRSVDRGKTWSEGKVVNDVAAAAREGFHAMASNTHGLLFSTWLDQRGTGTNTGAKLFGSQSTDGGKTWSKNTLVYESPSGSICECCHPSLAIDDSGKIMAMFRNSLNGNRDLYIATSADGVRFDPARQLGKGHWALKACPTDGGGIAQSGNRIITAWRREKELFTAVPGEAETKIGEGKDIAIALTDRALYAIWSKGGEIELKTPTQSKTMGRGAFPAIVSLGNGSVIGAWENEGKLIVQQIR